MSSNAGLLTRGTEDLANVRRRKVGCLVDEYTQRQLEMSAGYNRLSGYRAHVLRMLTTRLRMRICSDDRMNARVIAGDEYCTYKVIKTAGYMEDKAFRHEFSCDCEESQRSGIRAVWIDLNHDNCVGLGHDLELGRTIQDRQWRIAEEVGENGIYIPGEVKTDTYELTIRGRNASGKEVTVTTEGIKEYIPEEQLTQTCYIDPFITSALLETEAFHRNSIYPLTRLFRQSLLMPEDMLGDDRSKHNAVFGATGLGMGWRSGDVFVVTAHLNNPHSMEDAERSMGIGIPVVDANEEIEEDDPIVWFCCHTYDMTSGEQAVINKAKVEANKIALQIRQFESLRKWFENDRVVLVPAIIDRETGALEPLKPLR